MRPWLEEGDNRRAFVIISDAFRYEAAQELAAELNGKYRFEATLTSQLGVLPSYTALGMASLLPHKTLAYKGDRRAGGRQVERRRRAGRHPASRGRHGVQGRRTDGEEEGRRAGSSSRTSGWSTSTTTRSMPSATTPRPKARRSRPCGEAIDELAALVGYIVNNLNGHHIVVTADHGFLFTETRPSRDRQEQAGREAGRHGPRQETLPAGPQAARPRCGLARQDRA